MSEIQETYHPLTSPLARQAPRWDFGAVYSARIRALFGEEIAVRNNENNETDDPEPKQEPLSQ
jgi:hypothetical protein